MGRQPSINVTLENRGRFERFAKGLETHNDVMTRLLNACEIIQKLSLPNEDLVDTANRLSTLADQKEERLGLRTTKSVL